MPHDQPIEILKSLLPGLTVSCESDETTALTTWTLTGPRDVVVYPEIDQDDIGTARLKLIVDRWCADARCSPGIFRP